MLQGGKKSTFGLGSKPWWQHSRLHYSLHLSCSPWLDETASGLISAEDYSVERKDKEKASFSCSITSKTDGLVVLPKRPHSGGYLINGEWASLSEWAASFSGRLTRLNENVRKFEVAPKLDLLLFLHPGDHSHHRGPITASPISFHHVREGYRTTVQSKTVGLNWEGLDRVFPVQIPMDNGRVWCWCFYIFWGLTSNP